MIDPELVNRKLLLISKDLEGLQRIAEQSLDAFLASSTSAVLAERYIERAVGRMIDINYHLLTESGQAPPPDYDQSFVQLATLAVYPPEFGLRIAAAAGLKNRIAHEYDDLDPQKLFDAVRQSTLDVPEYMRFVHAWLMR